MRQGQQNRRGRGRNNGPNHSNNNNGNRKSQNPLTRSFESAGPDVKLRGTPSHIAEKYITLARDALSSGDPVLAENYLQHAEHYNRIILSFREQQVSQGGDPYQNGMARTHSLGSSDGDGDEFGDDDGDDASGQGQPNVPQSEAPQPSFQPAPQQRYDNRPQRHDNQQRDQRNDNRHNNNNRNDRNDNRYDRQDRGDRQDRFGGEQRNFRDDRDRGPQQHGQGAGNSQPPSDGQGNYRRRERFGGPQPGGGHSAGPPQDANGLPPNAYDRGPAPQPVLPPPPVAAPQPVAPTLAVEQEQPAFLRRPVRRPKRDDGDAPPPRLPVTEDQD